MQKRVITIEANETAGLKEITESASVNAYQTLQTSQSETFMVAIYINGSLYDILPFHASLHVYLSASFDTSASGMRAKTSS